MARASSLFAVRMPGGTIGARALPSAIVASRVAAQVGGRVIVDPRSVQR